MNQNKNRFSEQLIKQVINILVLVLLCASVQASNKVKESSDFVRQSEREIPLEKSVDVLIVGGSVPAVAAAVEASKNGASVFLVAPKLYLGEDLCATLRLQVQPERELKTELEREIFGDSLITTPLKVKATLNKALLDANVEFVFGSFISDLLWTTDEKLAGAVICNRAGRQAIAAKTIIDATDNGWISQMAGAQMEPWNGESINFERTILLPGANDNSLKYEVKKLAIPMQDLSFSSFAEAEQLARQQTYDKEQLRAAESLFFVPPYSIICKKNQDQWNSFPNLDSDYFQSKNVENLFVLSGMAGVPRTVAASLLKPAALCEAGIMVGYKSAELAATTEPTSDIHFKINSVTNSKGDIGEILTGFRPVHDTPNSIKQPETGLPVLANYDVVVVGGGTSGAPAAISAGRMWMKVLVVEYQEGLGGVGTLGLIGKPWHGRNVGFAKEVPFPKTNIEPKMEWYRSEIKKVGGDIWLGVLGCGAYVEDGHVKGIVVATPEGRGVIRANVVIDGTGNADVAIAAGADYMYGDIENGKIALQGTGLPSRKPTGNYVNTDYLLVDETDVVDVWRTLISVQQTKNADNIYDVGSLIQSRERRRIVGEYELNYLDQVMERTFPDVIVFSGSDYDSHGYPSSPYFALLPHDKVSWKQNHPAPGGTCYTPFRSLIPKKLDGIIVTGLGISMHRDASAMVRMQLDLANQGYAAGAAASMAISSGKELRDIDIKELQKILIAKGNLPDSVLNLGDSFPLSNKTVREAVADYGKATNPTEAGKPLAIILTHKEEALREVKKVYKESEGKEKLQYARLLGVCGEKDGIETLLAEIENFKGWDEKIFQGSMADYAHLPTPTDGIIWALGNTLDKRALPALLKLTEQLDSDVTLSHHRALALALEKLADPSAAKPLADLLAKQGMQGHAMLNLDDAMTDLENDGKGKNSRLPLPKRTKALREIILARALYNCGDYNDVGRKILESYRHDMRGLFARHATNILDSK
ncbi:FAD-dependent oxidoreductase [Draconibacterium mangrovi]|uniref:FAD-dependent oxidoreductase n=1 Tax=Draconibacterium mangrovi TaxID=2697469 RepID=UPI0013D2C7F5|nr:FAD-dependent oxidoreductase [Draconibacterium mangrovi]